MSANSRHYEKLFPATAPHFHALRIRAKASGLSFTAERINKRRRRPFFVFKLADAASAREMWFFRLDDVEAVLSSADMASAYASYRQRLVAGQGAPA